MIFVRIILVIMLGLDIWWWWRADLWLRPIKHHKFWRGVLTAFMVVMLATVLTRMLRPAASRTINGAIPVPVVIAQYEWHILILPFVCLLPILWRGILSIVPKRKSDAVLRDHPLPGRRRFIQNAAVAAPPIVLGSGVIAGQRQLGHFRISKLDLRIPHLPSSLEGMTVAHLSDFHVGRFMPPSVMRTVIDATNSLHADLVLITGDLIDYALIDLPAALDELMHLRPPRGMEHSVAMCIGNHDVIEDEKEFVRQVRQSPIPLLVNSSRTVELRGYPVQLLGIDWARRSRDLSADDRTFQLVRQTVAQRDPTAFPILLAHHPHAYEEAARQDMPLTLCGHTHGGQLMLTKELGAGPMIFRYWSGLYTKPRGWTVGNGSQLVVSNGIGNWFPLRINAPAEIAHLTLHRAMA
jgi:hypothetical protein